MGEIMIEINNLNKSFGSLDVLKDISLKVCHGEIYGLVGRSGAGKSTLLRCINGLEDYDSGSLKVDGEEVREKSKTQIREFRKNMGMIFQLFSLVERRTVYQNVALPMKCWNYKKEEIDRRVKELLDLVQISDKIFERPTVLSGGQKQRVAIARALALEPKILLCDEATSALDPKTTKSVLRLLRDINKKLNLTIVVVTHQMGVVRDVCDTISVLEEGRIVTSGEVKEVFLRKPKALRNLLGSEDDDGLCEGARLSFILSEEKMDFIPSLFTKYPTVIKVVSSNTARYKERPFTEFTVDIPYDKKEEIIAMLDRGKILWHIFEGNGGGGLGKTFLQ